MKIKREQRGFYKTEINIQNQHNIMSAFSNTTYVHRGKHVPHIQGFLTFPQTVLF